MAIWLPKGGLSRSRRTVQHQTLMSHLVAKDEENKHQTYRTGVFKSQTCNWHFSTFREQLKQSEARHR